MGTEAGEITDCVVRSQKSEVEKQHRLFTDIMVFAVTHVLFDIVNFSYADNKKLIRWILY